MGRSTRKPSLVFLGALAIAAALHMSCSQETEDARSGAASSAAVAGTPRGGERPDVYPPRWPQFIIDGTHDSRVITIYRSGAGSARRAEYHVFELVDGGRRLAQLHGHTLRNDYRPWVWHSLGRGRFLVTVGEVPGYAATENCLVIYDFVRNVSIAWRQEDFLPATILDKMKEDGDPYMGWYSALDSFDPGRLLYYPNDPEHCRKNGAPFLVVDLRSRSVQLVPVPDLPLPEVVSASKMECNWRWSMGNASEPAWNAPSLLPTYLLAVADQKEDRIESLVAIGLIDGRPGPVKNLRDETVAGWQTCFKLDLATGDYLRCPVSEWVARSEKAESR